MQSAHPTPAPDSPCPPRVRGPFAALAILVATLAAYYPSINGGMLWDDAAHVTAPSLRTLDGLRRIWFQLGTTQQYYPVLHSAFWLEHRIWGDSLLGYHLVNVGLHAAAACLFALVLARARPTPGALPGSEWLAAAVFALHPVCVESVAWISEQKNTLSLVFYLLSALAYLRFERARAWGWYFPAFGLFILALLSKSVTATLPAALLLLIAWRRGRVSLRDALPLVPWLAVGVCSGLFTAWVERVFIGARGQAFDLGIVERCFLAGRIFWFYLGRLLWPADLMFVYPRWTVAASWSWSLGCLGLAAVIAVLWAIRGWSRAPLVGVLFFAGSLLPALGFVNVYPFIFSYVADHFQYLASLGIIALAADGGAGVAWGFARREGGRGGALARRLLVAVPGAVLAALFVLTWRQSAVYRDAGALYSDTLAKNPGCWMADNNLGVYLMDRGSLDGAISHLEDAVRLKPDYSDAHNNLGNALSKLPGKSAESIAEFRTALILEPGMAQAHANLGMALVKVPGTRAKGIEELVTALRGNADDPDYTDVHASLAGALAEDPAGLAEALTEYEAALRLRPGSADARNGYGVALARSGRQGEAAAQFELALRLRPGDASIHNNLGGALAQLGRGPEAIAQYREAIRLDPGSAGAHFNLGRALRHVDDDREAIAEHREAERLAPGSAEIRSSLGSVFYRLGRVPEALAEYREAVRLEPGSAPYRNNLGVALTAADSLDEAMVQFREALRLAPGYADAHYNLGVALKRAGHGDEAAAEFSAAGGARP
jgi:tetratricopeptide (TPR) repeat protein